MKKNVKALLALVVVIKQGFWGLMLNLTWVETQFQFFEWFDVKFDKGFANTLKPSSIYFRCVQFVQ